MRKMIQPETPTEQTENKEIATPREYDIMNAIKDIENSSNGLAESIDDIRQSMEDIDALLAPCFKRAGVVIEYDDYVYQSKYGIIYHLAIGEHDEKWGLYLKNIMQWIQLSEASMDEITQTLPHILPFLEKYATVIKGFESEYAPVAGKAKRLVSIIKGRD